MGQKREKQFRNMEKIIYGISEDVDELKRAVGFLTLPRYEMQPGDVKQVMDAQWVVHTRKETRHKKREQKRRTYRWVLAALVLYLLAFLSAVLLMTAQATEVQDTRMDNPAAVVYHAPATPAATPEHEGEDPTVDEMELIDAALVQQGYFRDDVPLPYEEQDLLQTAGMEFGIPYALGLAIVEQETRFTNITNSYGDCIGYMQIMPKWHRERMAALGVDDLLEPYSNFRVGCSYLVELLEDYDLGAALSVYKSGTPTGGLQYSREVLARYAKWESVLNNG